MRKSLSLLLIAASFCFASAAAAQEPPPPPQPPRRIRIGGSVAQAQLVNQVRPVYPPLARQARIQGIVKLQVIIAKDGKVMQIEVTSGHPLLQQAALEAVKQWEYKPTLLNGEPVEVATTVDVVFTLSDNPPVVVRPPEPRVRLLKPDRAQILQYVEPEFEIENLAKGAQGRIELEVTIDAEGKVTEVHTEEGAWEFSNAAEAAIRQWVFAPDAAKNEDRTLRVQIMFESPERADAHRLVTTAAESRIKANPLDPKPYYQLGLVARNQSHFIRAAELFRQALHLDPGHRSARSELIDLLGDSLNDPESLAIELRSAAARETEDSAHRAMLGDLLLKLGDVDGAIAEYEFLRRAFPEERWCDALIGALYRKDARTAPDAVRKLAAECGGNPADFHMRVGARLLSQMRLQQALAHLEEAQRLEPGKQGLDRQIQSVRMVREGAQCAQQKLAGVKTQDPKFIGASLTVALTEYILAEDLDKSLSRVRAVARQRDLPAGIYLMIGELLTQVRGMDAAIAEMQQFAALRPTSPSVHSALSWALLRRGRAEEALAASRHALSLDQNELLAHAVAASALSARGRDAEAAEEMNAAGVHTAKDALERLQAPVVETLRGIEEMIRSCDPEAAGRAEEPGMANETSAVGSLRTLIVVSMQYHSTYGGFPPSLASLGPATPPSASAADLIDATLASGTRNGYRFTYTAERTDENGKITAFSIHAEPLEPGTTGKRYFYVDASGVIRAEVMTRASASSPPVQ